MSLDAIVKARIHPGIGIARIGNSDEYFIGPEIPYPVDPPSGGYKDAQGRLKRQAARFRIYGYDKDERVVAELTQANATINWTVHVANKKAAWYDFDVALDLPEAAAVRSARRNSQIQNSDRKNLVIDPGPRTIPGKKGTKPKQFDTGQFLGHAVYLGELRTDDEGRLLFLGGRGISRSPLPGFTLTAFANNPGWYDDASDGPVSATLTIRGRTIPTPVDSAWVITAPPNYAPDIVAPQTMYDVVFDTMLSGMLARPAQPSFTNDILPVLRQLSQCQWVNAGFLAQFGWQAPNDFTRPDFLMKLARPPGKHDLFQEFRRQIFLMFRNPGAQLFDPLKWPPIFGDAFGNFDAPPSPRAAFAVTPTLYAFLGQWMQGNFKADYRPGAANPKSLRNLRLAERPAALDRAALHFCMGGPFHPGCEMTWPMRQVCMYRSPFRLRERPAGSEDADYGEFLTQPTVMALDGPLSSSGPGDITKWMAVPWQADTASCRALHPPGQEFPVDPVLPTFWPARVPNHVLTEADYKTVTGKKPAGISESRWLERRIAAFNNRQNWLRVLGLNQPYFPQITKMVRDFGRLGLIEKRVTPRPDPNFPDVMYVETKAPGTAPASGPHRSYAHDIDFVKARFRQLR